MVTSPTRRTVPRPARVDKPPSSLHAELLHRLKALADELGRSGVPRPRREHGGAWCDCRARRIIVGSHLPADARVQLLVHELAQALGCLFYIPAPPSRRFHSSQLTRYALASFR